MTDIEKAAAEVDSQNTLTLGANELVKIPSIGASLHEVETDTDQYGSRPPCFRSTIQECLFVLTTTMAIGQSSIFIGSTLGILEVMANDLHMSQAETTWINAAQQLSAGAFLLFFGKVADLFGRRLILLVSMGSFSICLLITGFAINAIYMDIFCGLMGLTCAAAVPPAIGILGAVYKKPSRRKNRAFACFSAGNPLGYVMGALSTGITTSITTWRASFWVLAVIYGIFTVLAFFTVPHDEEQTKAPFNMETLRKFDWLGTFLVVGGLIALTAALTLGSDAQDGWQTSYVVTLLVIGPVFLIIFVWWESYFSQPLMPLYVWKDRNFTLLVTILCLGFYGFANNAFWLALYWQRIKNANALQVAVYLLPQVIGGITVNVIAAIIMHKISNKLIMIVGAIAWAGSSAILSGMTRNASYWAFAFPALVLSVVGADLEFTVTNMYVMSSLPSEMQSVAGGLFNTITRLATSVGLGVSTAVYSSYKNNDAGTQYRPYQSTFWVALAGAVIALVFLPFLTLKKQGDRKKVHRDDKIGVKK